MTVLLIYGQLVSAVKLFVLVALFEKIGQLALTGDDQIPVAKAGTVYDPDLLKLDLDLLSVPLAPAVSLVEDVPSTQQ